MWALRTGNCILEPHVDACVTSVIIIIVLFEGGILIVQRTESCIIGKPLQIGDAYNPGRRW